MKADRDLRRAMAIATTVWAGLLAVNDSLPFFGLRDDSCQTMFSDMEYGADWNTHWLVPQHAVSDVWASLDVRDVHIAPEPAEPEAMAVARWLTRADRVRNTEAVRVAVWQLCRRGHRVALDVRRTDGAHPLVHHDDACAVPELAEPHLWVPVRLYDTDGPAPE